MKKDIFKLLIRQFMEKDLSQVKERDLSLPLAPDKVISIVGMRRTGKTCLLYLLARQLRESIPRENIVYVNFEDDRLFPLELGDMDHLVQAYYELFPHKREEQVHFLFDEIQNVPHWETFIRRLQDTENCQICITGSSSRLLGKEIATALRGRTVTYELFPLSFSEFLTFKGVEYVPYSPRSESEVKHVFAEYVGRGGFPELVNYEEDLLFRTLKEYLDMIIYKDIVERYRVTNLFVIRYLMHYLIRNMANLVSPGKLFNDLKSQGLKISKNTVYNYISFMEEAFALFFIPVWTSSLRKEWRNPKKVYVIDHAIKKVLDTKEDIGRVYENITFMHLRRRFARVNYFKRRQEVDFFIENASPPLLLNVCYDFSAHETKTREVRGLINAMGILKIDKAFLLTADTTEEIKVGKKTLKVIPLWRWLLKNQN